MATGDREVGICPVLMREFIKCIAQQFDCAEALQEFLPQTTEDLVRQLRRLLREARQYVADAGSDEDGETQSNSAALLIEIDRVLL